jgi:hypothetical protein
MKMKKMYYIPFLMVFLLFVSVLSSEAAVNVQCPCDLNQDGDCIDAGEPPLADGVTCLHLGAGDGFARMADDRGYPQYIFSFADLTGVADADVMEAGILAAAWPAPAIVLNQGDEFYLSLSNVGMLIMPDLFDPHTVHFHGFPQSSTVFDGLPESGLSINMGATLTYYYNLVEPGTYMYHCHVEATEHMQMGMLGNLYVRAAQSWEGYAPNSVPAGDLSECDSPGDQIQGTPCGYAYNDQDGSTAYDLEYPIQLGSFDPEFHDASWTVQPLPFAMMWDR